MGRERRRTERIEILGRLEGEVMIFQPLVVVEVSQGGVQVETEFPLQLNSLHDFRLSLGDSTIVVKGRVSHCRIVEVDQERVTYRGGIEFIEMAERASTVIAEYISRLGAHRPS